jgi:multiple sugar transport system permease protein
MMAASTAMILPLLVLFFFTQRYFISGIHMSGIAGR